MNKYFCATYLFLNLTYHAYKCQSLWKCSFDSWSYCISPLKEVPGNSCCHLPICFSIFLAKINVHFFTRMVTGGTNRALVKWAPAALCSQKSVQKKDILRPKLTISRKINYASCRKHYGSCRITLGLIWFPPEDFVQMNWCWHYGQGILGAGPSKKRGAEAASSFALWRRPLFQNAGYDDTKKEEKLLTSVPFLISSRRSRQLDGINTYWRGYKRIWTRCRTRPVVALR